MRKLFFPILVLLFVNLLVFRQFFLEGLLPIPADILIGAYFPWLDYKWGYAVGVPVKNPLPSDVISMLYPWRTLGISIIQSGNLPLWDSTLQLGTPLLANFQTALLNPLNALFIFLSHPLAWSIQVILQPFLISLTAFLFLKNLGLKNPASVFGGLAFAFSGFSLVWMEYNTIGHALIFFPLTLLLIDKLIDKPKPLYSYLLGLSICLQLFSGYPQISVYTLIFSTIYLLYRLLKNQADYIYKLVLYFTAISSALLFAAIQLLPSFELLNLSIRSADQTAVFGQIQFLPLSHLITFLIPDFFGNPATGNYWSIGSYDNFAFYIPSAAVFFVLSSLFSRTIFNPKVFIFILMAGLSLLLSTDNILSKALISSDFLGLRSAVAARALFVFDLALSVIAAVELERILSQKTSFNLRLLYPLLTYLGILLGIGAVVFYFRNFLPTLISEAINLYVSLKNTLLPLATIGILTSLILLKNRLQKILLPAILAVLVFNIVYAADKYLTFSNINLLYPQTEALKFLQENLQGSRFDREKGELLPSNTWIPYGVKSIAGQNALALKTSALYFNILNNSNPNLPTRFTDLTNSSSPLYDTLDISYLAVLNRDPKTFSADSKGAPLKQFSLNKFEEVKNLGTVRILKNKANLGSAWYSENVICERSDREVIKRLQDPTYNPKKLTLINCDSLAKTNTALGTISSFKEFPNRIEVQTQTSMDNFLILSQAFYPGWQAEIDGRQTAIYQANLALSSVLVPAGEHAIELKYNPSSFFLGLKISLFTMLGWLAFLIIFRLKRKDV